MVKICLKPEEIFLCYSNSSYLPLTRAMTRFNMQWLNTKQAASSAPGETSPKKCLNFYLLREKECKHQHNHPSGFHYNLNQGSIQLWWAFVNMWVTFLKHVTRVSAKLHRLRYLPDPPRWWAPSALLELIRIWERADWQSSDPKHSIHHPWNKHDIDPWLWGTRGSKPEAELPSVT